jgi:hypothetical protein
MPAEGQGTGAAGAIPAGPTAAGTAPANQGPSPGPSWPYRWLVAFGRFWWDFLVGDTPELLIGALIILGVVALLVKAFSLNAAAVVVFPLMVAGLLWASVFHARPKR